MQQANVSVINNNETNGSGRVNNTNNYLALLLIKKKKYLALLKWRKKQFSRHCLCSRALECRILIYNGEGAFSTT